MKTLSLLVSIGLFGNLGALADDTTVSNRPSESLRNTSATVSRPMDNWAGRFGAGMIFGEPLGASVKYFVNDTFAIDGAAGWSAERHSDFYLHGDLLWHNFELLPVPRGRLPLYFGVGALLRFRNHGEDNQFGIRVPLGISYHFDNAPVDIFVEIGPALVLAPSVRGQVTGGIGARYWF